MLTKPPVPYDLCVADPISPINRFAALFLSSGRGLDDEAVRHSEAGEVMGAGFHQVFAARWRPRYQEHTECDRESCCSEHNMQLSNNTPHMSRAAQTARVFRRLRVRTIQGWARAGGCWCGHELMESINNDDGLQWNVVTSPLPDGSCGATFKYTVDVDTVQQ